VHDCREREYTLRGSETRTLSTVGAFQVVPARDLRDRFDRPVVIPDKDDERDGDLRVVDESGEAYLFSADRFVAIDVPAAVKASLLRASYPSGTLCREVCQFRRAEGSTYSA
jgi:hypothetical protein